jgi:glycerate kinase
VGRVTTAHAVDRPLSLFSLIKDAQPSRVRVLVAFDKFKGSLTAVEACESAIRALRGRKPAWELDPCPLTDGGDGFAEILTTAAHGRRMTFSVTGPRHDLISAGIGLVPPSQISTSARSWLQLPESGGTTSRPIAIVEMAASCGLSLLPPDQRDPWQTTSYGIGQLIHAVAGLGCIGILLGVGGSATNDLGVGALSALGFEFRDADGARIRSPVPMDFDQITHVAGRSLPSIPPICIACDVKNPLLGPNGATAVFGPQKGLRPEDQPRMEAVIARFSRMLSEYCGQTGSLAQLPGTGAAGGLPFGLMAGMRARLIPGFDLVSAWLGLEQRIAAADIVITGEGSFDATSLAGKGPGAVAARAHALGKAVHVFAGRLGSGLPDDVGQLHAITPPDYPEEKARREASDFLIKSIEAEFS